MSASLVGSEMCIRDRCCTAPGSAAGGFSEFRRFGAVERAVWPVGRSGTCLLYTSDAADDM
eukprot:11536971-Alexandrium_andersonii.AAC.1